MARTAVILDGSALVRHGMAALVAEAGVTARVLAGTAGDALGALRPGELLVAGPCPDTSPHAVVRRARELGEATERVSVLVLVERPDRASILRVCAAGADGVLDRSAQEIDVRGAIDAVDRGQRHLGPSVLDALVSPRQDGSSPVGDQPLDQIDPALARAVKLTRRERAVLELLATGRSNREIADALHIGVETVKTHLSNVYVKLGVRRRDQAIAAALRSGLF